jgi:hypothetical protein
MTQEFSRYPPPIDRAGVAPERMARYGHDQHGDLVLMAYHADVGFLEHCSSELVERNAAEFARMRDLLVSIDPSMIRAKDSTIWGSAYRGHYDERLAEVRNIVVELSTGFDKARVALFRYADEVKRAKQRLKVGIYAEQKLDLLISPVAAAFTPAVRQAEPMRRWEYLRETAGFVDWVAELGMDLDGTRAEATQAYNEAGDAFGWAQSIERAAREVCLAELRRAYGMLPDIRGEFRHAAALVADVLPLRKKVSPDPYAWPPGGFRAGNRDISPELQRIRDLLAILPTGPNPRPRDIVDGLSHGGCYNFTAANKELIEAAAFEFGISPDLLASIAWREVGDRPHPLGVLTEVLRRAADGDWSSITTRSLPGSVDDTDFEPMAAPIRGVVEALGYDSDLLSHGQLCELRSALRDPAQHIFIVAKYLERLKADSGFADVQTDQLTHEQCQELAARYRGGPHWSGSSAQSYGHGIVAHLGQARAALR